jgi:predicted phage baseplate assembly protein
VRNPLPARGGSAPESFEQVRQFAPQAFRRQERAVTEADWAEVAQRFAGVQRAVARFRWTGSWYTVFVTIDRLGGLSAARDPRFKTALRAHLERYRLAGYDLEIADPIYVPLDLELLVCVRPGYFRSDVLTALRRVFSGQEFADGTNGFFHPDNFTFGQSLFLSRVYAAAMAITGVASVELKKFQRWGQLANHELANALITAAPLEILRLDGDRNFPENGKIEFDLHGGL